MENYTQGNMNSQLIGTFQCEDPNAWIDRKIFFYAKNNLCNPYGYGVDIQNVSIVANNEYRFDFDLWPYGAELIIDESDGVKFEKGSTVVVYVNGQYLTEWICPSGNPTTLDIAMRAWNAKPKGLRMGKFIKMLLKKR